MSFLSNRPNQSNFDFTYDVDGEIEFKKLKERLLESPNFSKDSLNDSSIKSLFKNIFQFFQDHW